MIGCSYKTMNKSPSEQHREASPTTVRCAVITVSDTRTLETDRGGQTIIRLLTEAGHPIVAREIIPDEPDTMTTLVKQIVVSKQTEVILMTGGTGISPRDQTFETIDSLCDRVLPGYGELLRWLSYQEIGASAMLSRALAGVIGDVVVLTMPGSPNAVKLAMQKLILPELGHLVQQVRKTG